MEHYHKTAMPTSTQWWAPYPVDPEQICTRLPWEKEEQTPAVLSHKEVSHYTERFSKKATNKPVPMTIAVHGKTRIGNSALVERLVGWSNPEEATMDELHDFGLFSKKPTSTELPLDNYGS